MPRAIGISGVGSYGNNAVVVQPTGMQPLQVHDNARTFRTADGKDVVLLWDTVWTAFHHYTEPEFDTLISTRKNQGFNGLCCPAIFWSTKTSGSNVNAYNESIWSSVSPWTANEAHWVRVDRMINAAKTAGLYIILTPVWRDYAGFTHSYITSSNADAFATFLVNRYKDQPHVVWMAGGDWETSTFVAIQTTIVNRIRSNDNPALPALVGYHTSDQPANGSLGISISKDWNGCQPGHSALHNTRNYTAPTTALATAPLLPMLNVEPCYEDHPINWGNLPDGFFRDPDVRWAAYQSILGGSPGIVYGHHSVWQHYASGFPGVSTPDRFWDAGLTRPGSVQMGYMQKLFASRTFSDLLPDQGWLASSAGSGSTHIRAAVGTNYGILYLPQGGTVDVHLGYFLGSNVICYWFNPRTNQYSTIGTFPNTGKRRFSSATSGGTNDWVLVVDDAAAGYANPGPAASDIGTTSVVAGNAQQNREYCLRLEAGATGVGKGMDIANSKIVKDQALAYFMGGWFWVDENSVTAFKHLLYVGFFSQTDYRAIEISDTGAWNGVIKGSNGIFYKIIGPAAPMRTWVHLGLSKAPNATQVQGYTLWVNGVAYSLSGNPEAVPATITTPDPLRVSNWGGASGPDFTGYCDDIIVVSSNTAFDSTFVNTLMNTGEPAGREAGVRCYYRFNEGFGQPKDYAAKYNSTHTPLDATVTGWSAAQLGVSPNPRRAQVAYRNYNSFSLGIRKTMKGA